MVHPRKIRILHFVHGNLRSGATHVAIHLVSAALSSPDIEPLLALHCKRKDNPEKMLADLRAAGISARTVPRSKLRTRTIFALVSICREFRPDILLAHGFSEHLWGRYAGLLAGVPHLVHIEHNTRERYTLWQRVQTRWLAKRTARFIGISEGVRQVLLDMGMPPERTITIHNGIDLDWFTEAPSHPLTQRIPGIVMAARLDKQKDHPCLLHALAHLRERNLAPPVLLAGSGRASRQRSLQQLSSTLGLDGQVLFLGQRQDVPSLMLTHRICVLISHWEGFGLALAEGMAAGCAVVASDVPGMREVVTHDVDGLLVPPGDPIALADALERLLRDDALAARLGTAARETAMREYGRERMNSRYEHVFRDLTGPLP